MMDALHDVRWILRVTTTQRDPKAMLVIRYLMLAALAIVVVGVGVFPAGGKLDGEAVDILGRAVLGIAGLWLAVVWSMLFVPGSMLLNSAANARLVPRQRRRLMQMASAGWLLGTAAFSAMLGSWAAIPMVGGYLLGFGLIRAGSGYGGAPVILGGMWPLLSRSVLPPALVEGLASTPGLLALAALLLLGGAWTLRWLYPAGGDTHLDRRGDRVRRMQRFDTKSWAASKEVGGLTGWSHTRLYSAALRRDCRRPRPGPMLMHALGPVAHWTSWLSGLGVLLIFAIGLHIMLDWRGGATLHDVALGFASVGLQSMVIANLLVTAAFGQQMRSTRGEQALLRMTPLAGEAASMNRRLAVELLMGTLRNWTLTTVVILVASALIGGLEILVSQAATCIVAGQLALFGLLGNYADRGGWNPSLVLWVGLLGVLESVAALGLGWATTTAPWPWMAGIGIAAAGIQLRHSWRRMLAAPPAFPAGRMA